MKKWFIAFIGLLVHLLLGTVYAWSYFQTPIVTSTNWSNVQVAWAFSISIFMLGISAAWAGLKLSKYGPRKLAMLGGVLYASGYLLSSLALSIKSIGLLYIGFGIFGGIGLGLAYVTPVATVAKWFSKHQGLATGMVVMGFGFGALVMSKVLAPLLMFAHHNSLEKTFLFIGIIFLILLPVFSWFLEDPSSTRENIPNIKKTQVLEIILSRPFMILWAMFLINITAGMVFIGFQSALLQDLLKVGLPKETNLNAEDIQLYLMTSGATLIAVSSVFNGIGRFFWATLSDKLGRITTFRILLLLQVFVFASLLYVTNPLLFSILICVILLCYGGGFGLIPTVIKDQYGEELMPVLYGSILTAWSLGGILGPQLVAYMKDNYSEQAGLIVYSVSGSLLLIGWMLSFFFKYKISQPNG